MTFVSLFAGVGGFDVAFENAGHECVGQCEIDPHARQVLERHWPQVSKHDDVTTLKADTFAHPDMVTFGSPCQDLSVAGKRTGLTGERSGLFLEAVRYIREVQEATSGAKPKLALWENVPGAFSSNDGHDFAAVLQGLVGGTVRRPAGGWGAGGTYAGVAFGPLGSAEWRVLDSQHFGVPQRRNRVFLVYRPGGESAGSVLLESQGMPGNLEAGREARSNIAGAITGGLGSGGPSDNNAQAGHIIPTLLASGAGMDRPAGIPEEAGYVIPTSFNWQAAPAQGLMIDHDQAVGLDASQTKAVAFPLQPVERGSIRQDADASETHTSTLLRSLRHQAGEEAFSEWGVGVIAALRTAEILRSEVHGDSFQGEAKGQGSRAISRPLASEEDRTARAMLEVWDAQRKRRASQGREPLEQRPQELGAYLSLLPHEAAPAQSLVRDLWQASEGLGVLRQALSAIQEARGPDADEGKPAHGDHQSDRLIERALPGAMLGGESSGSGTHAYAVRRLTPRSRECERLQGFPDDHTRYRPNGTEIADTHRYRMMGNAVTVNVVEWIGGRLA